MDFNQNTTQDKIEKESRKRFLESANKRTNNVIKAFKVLANCSNKNLYDYSPEDIDEIFNTLEKVLRDTRGKFSIWDDVDFKLKDDKIIK
jgi:hypothetical protein